jgi:thioredoxin reductase
MQPTCTDVLDAAIVGGGPAGLSAALLLGRCRRRVLVLDDGRPRNAASCGVHGFLTRDGTPPAELLRIAREQLAPYTSVRLRSGHVADARRTGDGFELALDDGARFTCRTLVLATGVVDRLPDIPGFEHYYGRGVYPCPYCDGWEMRDRPLAAYGDAPAVARLGLALTTWSRDVIVCVDDERALDERSRRELQATGVRVVAQPIVGLEGDGERLEALRLRDGSRLARAAVFFTFGVQQRSALAARLGCRVTPDAGAETDDRCATGVPGLFVAGDASRDVAFAIVAAAEGAEAAVAANKHLMRLDVAARTHGSAVAMAAGSPLR